MASSHNDLAAKLNRANALLFKIRDYVNQKVLRFIYFAIFDSLFNYDNLIWAQRIIILTKKSHQTNIISASKLSFRSFFQKNNVLKFSDKNMINNILFISQALNNIIPPIFKNWLQFCYNTHKYCTTSSVKGHLHKKIFQDE